MVTDLQGGCETVKIVDALPDSVTDRERLPDFVTDRVDNTEVLKARPIRVAGDKRMHKKSLIRHQKMVHGGADVFTRYVETP